MEHLEWGTPRRIETTEEFPIDVFPKWIANFVTETFKELNTKVDLPANAVLGTLSTAVMKKFKFFFSKMNWKLDLNVYIVVAARPGSKKDAVIRISYIPLNKIQNNYLEKKNNDIPKIISTLDAINSKYNMLLAENVENNNEELARLKKEKIKHENILNKGRFIISGDITQERVSEMMSYNNEMLTIATPEASELFSHLDGKYNSDSIDIFLKSWEGFSYSKHRSTKDDVNLEHPLLNLCLFTQPSEVNRLKKHEQRGLLQRFLISIPERYPIEEIRLYNKMDSSVQEVYNNNITKIYNFKVDNTVAIDVEESAIESFNELYFEIIKESYREDIPEVFQEWLSKVLGNLLKVVSIIKVARVFGSERDNTKISLNEYDILCARKLYYYYYNHFERVALNKNIKDSDLRYLFKRIIELSTDGRINATEINNNISRFNSEQRKKLLKSKRQIVHTYF